MKLDIKLGILCKNYPRWRVFFGNITDVIENYIFPNLVIKFAENESELSRTIRYSINKRGVKRQTSSKQL